MWTIRATLAVTLGLCFYLIGLINDLTTMYFLTSFVVSTGGTCFLLALFSLTGLSFEIQPDSDQVFEGKPVTLRIRARNVARMRKGPFLIRMRILNETRRLERDFSFYLQSVPARGGVEVTATIEGLYRGVHRWTRIDLFSGDLIGMFRRRSVLQMEVKCVVYPQIWSLRSAEGNVSLPEAARKERRVMTRAGLEFASVRPYADGDDLRYVHWPSSARLGKLAVKEFQVTGRPSSVIVLDVRTDSEGEALRSTSMAGRAGSRPRSPSRVPPADTESHAELAIRAAASLASDCLQANENLALLIFSNDERAIPFGSGSWQRLRILDSLARTQTGGEGNGAAFPSITANRFFAALQPATDIFVISLNRDWQPIVRGALARRIEVRALTVGEAVSSESSAKSALVDLRRSSMTVK